MNHVTSLGVEYSYEVKDREEAAMIYDRLEMLKEGLRAKTNFNYDKKKLAQVVKDLQADQKANTTSDAFQVTISHYS